MTFAEAEKASGSTTKDVGSYMDNRPATNVNVEARKSTSG